CHAQRWLFYLLLKVSYCRQTRQPPGGADSPQHCLSHSFRGQSSNKCYIGGTGRPARRNGEDRIPIQRRVRRIDGASDAILGHLGDPARFGLCECHICRNYTKHGRSAAKHFRKLLATENSGHRSQELPAIRRSSTCNQFPGCRIVDVPRSVDGGQGADDKVLPVPTPFPANENGWCGQTCLHRSVHAEEFSNCCPAARSKIALFR